MTASNPPAPVIRVRRYEPARDAGFLRSCIVELQEVERALDPRLPPGGEMAGAAQAVIERRCAEWDGAILVAEEEEEHAGLMTLYLRVPSTDPDEPPGTFALVSELVVRAGRRRRGIGRALLEEALRRSHAAGAPVLRIESMAGNEAALEFYARHGFRPRVVELERTLAMRPHVATPPRSTASERDLAPGIAPQEPTA